MMNLMSPGKFKKLQEWGGEFWKKLCECEGSEKISGMVQRKFVRSRKMLKNTYLDAKFGVDAAKNIQERAL